MTLENLDALAAWVPDGALVALPPDNSLTPAAFARALVRAGKRELRLVGVPVSGYATDLLIGAGCVASVQTSGVSLGEAGFAPCFTRALAAGQVKVIDNPFAASGDPIVLLPALQPDIAVFHAVMADPDGNVWVGKRRELATIAHAARRVLVTVERLTDGNLLDDDQLAPGTISGTYVDAVALAERGAWPIALLDEYGFDAAHMAEYAKLARSEDGFRAYLDRYVLTPPARAAAE